MIDDRSQYDFVDIPDNIIVNGGIMPVRDGDGKDSKNCLRGEDPAHLLEATMRTKCVVNGQESDGSKYQIDNIIRIGRLATVYTNIKELSPKAIVFTNNTPVVAWDTDGIQTERSLDYFLAGGVATEHTMVSNAGDYNIGGTDTPPSGEDPGLPSARWGLRLAPVSNLFTDLHGLKVFQLDDYSQMIRGQAYSIDTWVKPGVTPATPQGLTITGNEQYFTSGRCLYLTTGTVQVDVDQETNTITKLNYWIYKDLARLTEINFGMSIGDDLMKYVKDVYVCLRMKGMYSETRVGDTFGGHGHPEYNCAYYPIKLRNDGGVYTLHVDDVNTAVSDFLNHYEYKNGFVDDDVYYIYSVMFDSDGNMPYDSHIIVVMNDDTW